MYAWGPRFYSHKKLTYLRFVLYVNFKLENIFISIHKCTVWVFLSVTYILYDFMEAFSQFQRGCIGYQLFPCFLKSYYHN